MAGLAPAGPTQREILEMAGDPVAFRDSLVIEADDGPKIFGDVVEPWQDQDFEALDPAWLNLTGRIKSKCVRRGWFERPRGHSKTNDIAMMVAWAIFAAPRKISGIVAAGDKDQAKLLREAVDGLVRLNPWLGDFLDVQAHVIVNPVSGSRAEIISSDAPTSYGITPDFIICDELTHWGSRELWDSLFSSAAKRSRCLLIVITNAGFEKSWQWPLREGVRENSAWYFHRLDGPTASWITAEVLEEQRKLLPSVSYARLWLNQWASGGGDAISPELIQAAVRLDGPTFVPDPEWVYVAGLDLGVKRDACAFVIVGKHVGRQCRESPADDVPHTAGPEGILEDLGFNEKRQDLTVRPRGPYVPGSGRLKLVTVRIWVPKEQAQGTVKLASVASVVRELHAIFRFASVACDQWQALPLIEEFVASGIAARAVYFTAEVCKSIAEATMSAFTEQQIDLYESRELLADLAGLRLVEKSYGVRLESPRSSSGGTHHGDTATALSLALVEARGIREMVLETNRPVVLSSG